MRSLPSAVGLAIVVLCAGPAAHGQRSTEQYIPIGMSPGVSQKYTSLGVIDTVSARQRTATITEPNARRTVRITDKTHIWLDRSKLRLPNLRGRFEDLQASGQLERLHRPLFDAIHHPICVQSLDGPAQTAGG